MTTQVLRTIAAGILAGIALFMMPFFLIRILIFLLLIKAIFSLLGWRRRWRGMHPAYAHKYQQMTEEERKAFMEKYGHYRGCGSWNRNQPAETKSDSNV